MKTFIKVLLITVLFLGEVSLNEGHAENRAQRAEQATKDCKSYFGLKSFLYRDFCECVGSKVAVSLTAEAIPTSSRSYVCDYKYELGEGMYLCTNAFIDDKSEKKRIDSKAWQLMDEANARMCEIKW